MAPEPEAPDRPFPGARSQVPGLRYEGSEAAQREPAAQRSLELESTPTTSERGWSVRLPVRAEHISVDKQVVVYERVLVRRREIEDLAQVQGTVRKEEPRVTVDRDSLPGPHPDVSPRRHPQGGVEDDLGTQPQIGQR
ncbi:MAG: YsnF/AvaK domain-containing protein [Chloroflexota bacterium]|nr:YsnF/AvaK domain-containing protein [Chloroflexota bacterium]